MGPSAIPLRTDRQLIENFSSSYTEILNNSFCCALSMKLPRAGVSEHCSHMVALFGDVLGP